MFKNPDLLRGAAALLGLDRCPRVLIVEDHADLAQIMTLLLRHCGFDVRTLHHGNLVLATARTFRPQFILLDIGLPDMDGYEVAELIRSDPLFHDVIIIASSAIGPNVHAGQSGKAAFNHHLTKPFYLDDLLPLLVPG